MRLEIGNIFITDVQFGNKTEVVDKVLYINKEEIEKSSLRMKKLKVLLLNLQDLVKVKE